MHGKAAAGAARETPLVALRGADALAVGAVEGQRQPKPRRPFAQRRGLIGGRRIAAGQRALDQFTPSRHAVGDGICSVDANGVITFANKAALDILGCIEQQLIGVPAVEIVVEGETLAAGSGYDQVRREVILRRRDGTTFPAELVCVPIVSKGHSAGVVATFADISERKAKEAQPRRIPIG